MKSVHTLILLGLLLLVNTTRLEQRDPACCPKDHTLSISGTGRVSIPTDCIRLGFTIETKEMEAGVSFTKNNEISSKVNQILLNETNIPEKNITTVNYQIAPKYTSVYVESNKTYVERFEGYIVSNQINVELSQKETATRLVDSIVKAGVTKINYINFDVQPDVVSEAKKKILGMAVKDAFDRAKIIAQNSNVKIVDVLSINVAEPYVPSTPTYLARSGSMASVAESTLTLGKTLYTGEQQLTVTANLIFLVKKS
jgi:uncharacterized protein YggE